MAANPATETQNITVFELVNGIAQFIFEENGRSVNEIKVPQGLNFLNFELKGDADFATFPFQWATPNKATGKMEPIAQPPNFTVHRKSNRAVTLNDVNTDTKLTAFHFAITVLADDKIFGSHDPTIVHLPPIP